MADFLEDDPNAIQLKQVTRKKGAKGRTPVNVTNGIVHVVATFNNTKVSVSDVHGNVLIVSAGAAHPDVLLSFGWYETHRLEYVVEAIMPSSPGGLQTVLGLVNDKGVSFLVSEFWPCCEAHLLLGHRAQVRIPDVSCPQLEFVQLGKERDHPDAWHRDNS